MIELISSFSISVHQYPESTDIPINQTMCSGFGIGMITPRPESSFVGNEVACGFSVAVMTPREESVFIGSDIAKSFAIMPVGYGVGTMADLHVRKSHHSLL